MVPSAPLADDPTAGILTINLDALKANYRLLASRAAPSKTGANVKANAYGLGIDAVVPALVDEGCSDFFVATLSEAVRVRNAASHARIFVLNGFPIASEEIFASHQLTAVLGSPDEIEAFQSAVSRGIQLPSPALHSDTGMQRLGLSPDETQQVAEAYATQHYAFSLALVMTHFVESETRPSAVTDQQIARFDEIRALFPNVPASLSNSSGLFLGRDIGYDLVRPGYALYGGNPCPGRSNPMQAVIRLDVPVIQTRDVPMGTKIGYGGEYTVKRNSRLATLSLGYADGYPRGSKTTDTKFGTDCLLAGRRCPIIGRLSMDLAIVDITDCPRDQVNRGTLATIFGDGISIDKIADKSGTIGYELLVHLGGRFRRRILDEKVLGGKV
jgi:alanine racemase